MLLLIRLKFKGTNEDYNYIEAFCNKTIFGYSHGTINIIITAGNH